MKQDWNELIIVGLSGEYIAAYYIILNVSGSFYNKM